MNQNSSKTPPEQSNTSVPDSRVPQVKSVAFGDTTKHFGPFTLLISTIVMFIAAQTAVVFVLGVYLATQGIPVEEGLEQVLSSNINNFYITVAITTVLFLLIRFVLRLQGLSLRSVGLVPFKAADLPRALAGWVVYFVMFIAVVLVLEGLQTGVDFEQEQQLEFTPTGQAIELMAIFASIVIAPAFIEELLMRGFLFMGLRKTMGFWPSTLVVSLLFGVAHLQFGAGEPLLWSAFADTFVLSIVLCYLTEKYRTLWPAILVHAMKNGLAFTYLFIFGR